MIELSVVGIEKKILESMLIKKFQQVGGSEGSFK